MNSLPRYLNVTLLVALAAITIATRWKIIAEHASPVPFHDQWSAEGTALLEPWFAGRLGAGDFWKSSNEHRPALTRALAFAEFRLTGEWNTRMQMLVNSMFYALTAVVLALVARHIFGVRGLVASAATLAVLFSLPCNYENAMWGFQSQFYLMMLLGAAYLGGTFCSSRTGRLWALAQVAGAVSLLAMGGAMLAPAAAAAVAAARLVRRRDAHSIATLAVALALAVGGWATIVPANDPDGVLQSRSAAILVEALIKLLAWPSAYWFLVPLMLAPWLLVSVRVLRSRDPQTGEVVLAAIGAWILLQSVAIAFGRGAHLTGIPPRYFDTFLVGLAVNAACLALLLRSRTTRIPVAAIAIAWAVAAVVGLWQYNKPSWIGPIIAGNGDLQRRTLGSVRDYIVTGEPAALTRDPFIAHHYPSIPIMRRLLDNPGLRASLPATVRGESEPSGVERFTNGMLETWPWVIGLGIAGLASAGVLTVIRSKRVAPATPSREQVPWFFAAALTALAALVLVGCGMHPWDTNAPKRLARILANSGNPVADFDIPDARNAVYTGNGIPGRFFFGTFIKADSFEGEKVSTEFPATTKFLLVPVAGYPGGPGNSLRVEILARDGSIARTVGFKGNSPGEVAGRWSVELNGGPDTRARLVLVDGSNKPRGWLAVGTPLLTDDPQASRRLDIALQSDRAETARRFPMVLLSASILFAGFGLIARRRRDAAQ